MDDNKKVEKAARILTKELLKWLEPELYADVLNRLQHGVPLRSERRVGYHDEARRD